MRRKIIGVAAAVLLAAVGTFTLLLYVRAAETRALAGERVVDVFVVTDQIERGTAAEDVELRVAARQVPAKVVPAGTVDDLDSLDGKVTAVDLVPGEQLLAARFITPEELVAQTAVEVPDGLHEVTVALDAERALGGRVKPGDTVGVLSSFEPMEPAEAGLEVTGDPELAAKTPYSTHMILHKVLVTNVQIQGAGMGNGTATAPTGETDGEEQGPGQAPSGKLLVTLAIDAPAVERLVFTAEHGTVWLSHEPEDAPEDGTQIQTRDMVYR